MTSLPGTEALTSAEERIVRRIVKDGIPNDHEIANVNVARLLATLDRDRARSGASLDEAWNEAEAALPSDDVLRWISVSKSGTSNRASLAIAWESTGDHPKRATAEATGPTPAAALQALAAALRARP